MEDERFAWTPVPVQYHIDEHSPYVNTRVSQSTPVPDRSQVASPLSSSRKPVTPGALGERNPDNLPHQGTVHEMARKFEYQRHSDPSHTRNTTHVPIVVRQDQRPSLSSSRPIRSRAHRKANRPQSCELVYLPNNIPVLDTLRGESLPPMSDEETEPNDSVFRRSSQARTPFRNKTPSNPPTEVEWEHDNRHRPSEDDNTSDATPVPPPPALHSQTSGDESLMAATRVLEELEEYMSVEENPSQDNESITSEKINKLSVRARTHLWELKTLPRSFKTRTKSQPCSPLKTSMGGANTPGTPTSRKHSAFTFNDDDSTTIRK